MNPRDAADLDQRELIDSYKSLAKWTVGMGVLFFFFDLIWHSKNPININEAGFDVLWLVVSGVLFKKFNWFPFRYFTFTQIILWAIATITIRGLLFNFFVPGAA
ncbi:MAG: hypothetical protein HYV65_02415 [Candidatus Spechtbacteria bacterium]|nr:hypothetical protein [Candidatus Spechtbacteria bacterium]